MNWRRKVNQVRFIDVEQPFTRIYASSKLKGSLVTITRIYEDRSSNPIKFEIKEHAVNWFTPETLIPEHAAELMKYYDEHKENNILEFE